MCCCKVKHCILYKKSEFWDIQDKGESQRCCLFRDPSLHVNLGQGLNKQMEQKESGKSGASTRGGKYCVAGLPNGISCTNCSRPTAPDLICARATSMLLPTPDLWHWNWPILIPTTQNAFLFVMLCLLSLVSQTKLKKNKSQTAIGVWYVQINKCDQPITKHFSFTSKFMLTDNNCFLIC